MRGSVRAIQGRDGFYSVRVTVGYHHETCPTGRHQCDGRGNNTARPIQAEKTVKGKREADKERAALVAKADAGQVSTSSDTVAAFLARWVETSKPRWAISTARRNAGIVDRVLVPALGSKKLKDLNAGHLAALYGSLTTAGEAPATVHRVHAVIARACSDAVAWGELRANPAPAAKSARPRITAKEVRPATGTEVDAIGTEAGILGPMWADVVELAASTGLRRGELAALRWSDIDTNGRTIRVAHSVATTSKKHTGATWVLTPTKGRKIRRIPLTDPAAGALDRQYKRASSTAPGAFVFSEDPTGLTPISPDRVSKMLRTARDAAGVPSDVSPVHALRGFAATTIGSAVSAREAQAWRGHDSMVTTERYLARVRDDEARAVAAINAARRPKTLSAPTVSP